MRDTFVAWAALGVAGVAIVTGLTIGAVGGAFSSNADYVAPPALQSDSSGVAQSAGSNTSSAIIVPPSPTWPVAGPQAPRRATIDSTPETSDSAATTTSRAPRTRVTRTPRSTQDATGTADSTTTQ